MSRLSTHGNVKIELESVGFAIKQYFFRVQLKYFFKYRMLKYRQFKDSVIWILLLYWLGSNWCIISEIIKKEGNSHEKARKKSRSRLENWDEMTEFLALVSKPEIRWKISRACLEAQDWKKEILVLVSKHEIERKKFSCSSRSTRLKERKSRSRLEAWDWKKEILDPVSDTRLKDRYSRSRLESWNKHLAGHCCLPLSMLPPWGTHQGKLRIFSQPKVGWHCLDT